MVLLFILALSRHLQSSLDIGVIYKDGKHYQFDTYWEMKARTDIQQDIGSNMVEIGHKNGVIFYISTFYGDCAKDHADYQGKIYYDEDWKSIAPKDRYDEIESYIAKLDAEAKSQELPDGSVNAVMNNKPFFTTRPNCRHYFQYIDIDSVLGAKTKEDVLKLRAERNLNFNGKYKSEKYQALQQQRANERKIRVEKKVIDKLEHELALKPGDKNIQSQIKIGEANVRRYQAEQRTLIKQYNNLERRYDREALENRVTLGVKLEPKPIGNNVNEHEDENNKTQMIEHSRDFAVDYTIIEARKYNNKVLNMVEGNLDDKRNIYPEIKDMLKHRSGTNGEDLIVYNLKTKELYVANKSTIPSGVEPDKQALDLINKDPQNVITIHNHPESLPPSINDLNALVERKQLVGFVTTHDGRIYRYTKPKTKIEGKPLARVIDKVRLLRYDEKRKE